MRFTISARGKPSEVPLLAFLARNYANVPIAEIDSVFGFVEHTPLYGGRMFSRPELTPHDIGEMYYAGVGLRLPLTNHYATEAEYEATRPLLAKYHRDGNAAIVTNDNLARWIRRDFPKYRIEASVIKNLRTTDRVRAALDLYDTVVLPMELNEDEAFLRDVPNKDRVTLFANAGCALTCPSKICYVAVSKYNKALCGEFKCSQPLKERDMLGMVDFDLQRLAALGFSRFKLLRSRPGGMTGY
ncbi:MAG: hypothetical protein A4S17_01635 [Proteobacteria bacterium HN_bin10]|nr:MAG: hypothetical protein A4S17_01635 [Proteobacteria bacterium HN_bin10]